MRYFHMWNNRRIMDKHIHRDLEERYNSVQDSKSKTIIDLAMNMYKSEKTSTASNRGQLDAVFKEYATAQMKSFIFAGHDTTSTTICYSWLLLSRYPEKRAKLRAELDAVLGEKEGTSSLLTENPALISRLPYTLAVIKETLRLFPVVSSPRKGKQDFILTDSKGQRFPTEHCLVWAVHHGVHHNPLCWPRVDELIPERFLNDDPERDDELRPLKNAWRPFEFGPRACIGTELALVELKVVLALTAREFELAEAYRERDRINKPIGVKAVNGERAYQIQLGSAHPVNGFPARIRAL